jgi:hypothetical protein
MAVLSRVGGILFGFVSVQKCHYDVYNSPSLIPTLSQNNLNNIPPSHFLKVKFNIILTPALKYFTYSNDPFLSHR